MPLGGAVVDGLMYGLGPKNMGHLKSEKAPVVAASNLWPATFCASLERFLGLAETTALRMHRLQGRTILYTSERCNRLPGFYHFISVYWQN